MDLLINSWSCIMDLLINNWSLLINTGVVISGWIVSFCFAVRANKKAFEDNKIFQKELLEINHENYKMSEFTKSSSSLASAIFRFHSDCSKSLSGLCQSKADRSVLVLVFEAFKSLQDQYIRVNEYYMNYDFWVKMSGFVSEDFKEIENKFQHIFSPNFKDLDQQGAWFEYQRSFMQVHKYENDISKLQTELKGGLIDDKRRFEEVQQVLKVALDERINHLDNAIKCIQILLDATYEVPQKINEFCVRKNDDYQKLIDPN